VPLIPGVGHDGRVEPPDLVAEDVRFISHLQDHRILWSVVDQPPNHAIVLHIASKLVVEREILSGNMS
jgi:hypothetical protein